MLLEICPRCRGCGAEYVLPRSKKDASLDHRGRKMAYASPDIDCRMCKGKGGFYRDGRAGTS